MTRRKTAVLWGRDDLLAQAMEFFIKAGEIWEVIRIPMDQSTSYLVEQMKRIKPDVIVLYPGNCVNDMSLSMQLIQNQPKLKVVAVSLENNLMQVYSKRSIMVREVSDFLSIIEDRYPPDHPVQKEVNVAEIND